jgi:hypothetical protein
MSADPIAALKQAIQNIHDGAHQLGLQSGPHDFNPNYTADGGASIDGAQAVLTPPIWTDQQDVKTQKLRDATFLTAQGFGVAMAQNYWAPGAFAVPSHNGFGDAPSPFKQQSDAILNQWGALPASPQDADLDVLRRALSLLNQALQEGMDHDSGLDAMFPFIDQVPGLLSQVAVLQVVVVPSQGPHVVPGNVHVPVSTGAKVVTTVAATGLGALAVVAIIAAVKGKTIEAVLGGAWRRVKQAF